MTVPVYCGIFRAALGGCDSGLHLAGHTRAGKPERHLQMKMDPPQLMVRQAHHERVVRDFAIVLGRRTGRCS